VYKLWPLHTSVSDGVPVPLDANGPDCIRCGECAAVCPTDAIHVGFDRKISFSGQKEQHRKHEMKNS
jgi:ferredoxin